MARKQFKQRKDDLEKAKGNAVLDRYGGAEHLKAPPREPVNSHGRVPPRSCVVVQM